MLSVDLKYPQNKAPEVLERANPNEWRMVYGSQDDGYEEAIFNVTGILAIVNLPPLDGK